VGRALGVRFFLECSVRKAAATIKISVRLIDSADGTQVWGEQYRRELKTDTLIALQEEIAQRVTARVGGEYGIITRTLSRESRQSPPSSVETYEAFLRFYHYITVLNTETFGDTLRFLEQAITRDPECGLAWCMLALLYCHNHTLEIASIETPLEKALGFAHRGVSLEPQNQLVRSTLVNLHFLCDERELSLLEADKALALNPRAPAPIGYLGWLIALNGEWERGLALMVRGRDLNPFYPGWFHMAPCFDCYRRGQYAEAYQEGRQFHMPQLFWDPLLRAAALGHLERHQAAGRAVAELLALKPDFTARGRYLMSFYAKPAALTDSLLAGLRKAGLNL
jgi:adenylate cyclase